MKEITTLPCLIKNRIKNRRYIDTKGNIVIWNGKILHCKHNKRKSLCKKCEYNKKYNIYDNIYDNIQVKNDNLRKRKQIVYNHNMERSCLLCVGSENILNTLIKNRQDSNKRDYMQRLFCIPIQDYVCVSAFRLTHCVSDILPENQFLHAGYCGEECRKLLIDKGLNNEYVICGLETPGCGYTTYDLVFPQGRCEKGERSKDAAVREFIEETGIYINPTDNELKFLGFIGKRKEMSIYLYLIES